MFRVKHPQRWAPFAAVLVLLALGAHGVWAQEAALPGSSLSQQSLRPYQFVFIAYTIAWVFVLGWVVSVARRLARLERRLQD